MAKLILTDEERAALLWTDCDDATLGALVRKMMVGLHTQAEQLDRTTDMAAALWLCCRAAEANAATMEVRLEGVTQDGEPFGDWLLKAERLTPNAEVSGGRSPSD